jgi:hypothetical protein
MNKIPDKTDEELKQIAIDIRAGRIFSDRHIPKGSEDMIHSIFMVFIFMDEAALKGLQDDPPGLIYEYMSKRGPMYVNGYPTFLSVRLLSKEDTNKVFDIIEQLEIAEKAVVPTTPPTDDFAI